MGTLEGFVMGQALAPDYDTGPAWEARAMREMARKEAAEAQVEKLSQALEKEHKRFLIERRERKSYMHGWNLRGLILKNNCGYTQERISEEENAIVDSGVYKERLIARSREVDNEVNREAGFPDLWTKEEISNN